MLCGFDPGFDITNMDRYDRLSVHPPSGRAVASVISVWFCALVLTATSHAETAETGGRSPVTLPPLLPFVSEEAAAGYFPLATPANIPDVMVAPGDWQVAQIAA